MERCCSDNPIFCRTCQNDHFSHQTNDLFQLLPRKPLHRTQQNIITSFTAAINVIQQTRALSSPQTKELMDLYLVRLEKDKKDFTKGKWHDQLYNFTISSFKRKVPAQNAKRKFHRLMGWMRFCNWEWDLTELALQRMWRAQVSTREYIETRELLDLLRSLKLDVREGIEGVALATSYERYAKESQLQSAMHEHRSVDIDHTLLDQISFAGTRLVVRDNYRSIILQHSLPNLQELHTKVPFFPYPNVTELGVCLESSSSDSDFFGNVPSSVTRLRVFVPHSTVHSCQRERITKIMLMVAELHHLKLKELSVSVPLEMEPKARIKLVSYAREQPALEVFTITRLSRYVVDFGKRMFRLEHESFKEMINIARQRQILLNQAATLEKRGSIKRACQHIRNEILEFCSSHLIGLQNGELEVEK